eukprot:2739072-Rhodomonas_salina.2
MHWRPRPGGWHHDHDDDDDDDGADSKFKVGRFTSKNWQNPLKRGSSLPRQFECCRRGTRRRVQVTVTSSTTSSSTGYGRGDHWQCIQSDPRHLPVGVLDLLGIGILLIYAGPRHWQLFPILPEYPGPGNCQELRLASA